jgi:chaperonin cofactor prefoldin
MAEKSSLELRIKGLEKSMGTIVKAFKELKAGMEASEKKVLKKTG